MTDFLQEHWKWVAVGTIGGLSLFALKRYIGGVVYHHKGSASGKTVIITGANCGIGYETAYRLACLKARVILACRDPEKGRRALDSIRRWTSEGDVVVKQLDLASFCSIRAFADEIRAQESRVDVLINNAAVFQCPFSKTEDGLETQMGVNYLGHFLLTNLLLDKLSASAPSRVVVVSSGLAKKGELDLNHLLMTQENYNRKAGYNNSKLACNYFARELARRVHSKGISVHCVSPGMVRTELGRHVTFPLWMKVLLAPFWFLLVKSTYNGCQSLLYCTLSEDLNGQSGRFYRNCAEGKWPEETVVEEVGPKLWDLSTKIVGL